MSAWTVCLPNAGPLVLGHINLLNGCDDSTAVVYLVARTVMGQGFSLYVCMLLLFNHKIANSLKGPRTVTGATSYVGLIPVLLGKKMSLREE